MSEYELEKVCGKIGWSRLGDIWTGIRYFGLLRQGQIPGKISISDPSMHLDDDWLLLVLQFQMLFNSLVHCYGHVTHQIIDRPDKKNMVVLRTLFRPWHFLWIGNQGQ